MADGLENIPKRVGFGCMMQILIFAIGVFICVQMSEIKSVSKQNTSTVTAVATSWSVVPFTSIRVTDDKCKSSEESVFIRHWGGTE